MDLKWTWASFIEPPLMAFGPTNKNVKDQKKHIIGSTRKSKGSTKIKSSSLVAPRPLVSWSAGPLVLRSPGLVLWSTQRKGPWVHWSPGALVPWSFGPLLLWSCGPFIWLAGPFCYSVALVRWPRGPWSLRHFLSAHH